MLRTDWELTSTHQYLPVRGFAAMFTTMLAVFRSRTAFQLEILALRVLGQPHRGASVNICCTGT